MSTRPASKAKRVLAALQSGSHRLLAKIGWPDYVFAFHDQEEIGPRMLARLAKQTGLRPDDL
jgi:predicted RNA binding protein YcfA (HicA-like mRNA interferase family)